MEAKEQPTGPAPADALAAGLEAGVSLPPPPDSSLARAPAPPITAPSSEPDPGPRGWRKFFAIVGIVAAFPFLLTIPGWIALSAYRKWKSGERAQPTWLIIWGVIASLLFLVAFVIGLTDPNGSTRSAVTAEPSPPVIAAPPGFTASEVEEGWTRYSSVAGGFSIALPPGWQAFIVKDAGPRIRFSADDRETTYAPMSDGERPQFYVLRLPVSGNEIPRRYYQVVGLGLQLDRRTVGDVQATTTSLPAGTSHVFRIVQKSTFGLQSITVYGLLGDTAEYRLLFVAPLKHVDGYHDTFDSIARTFNPVW